MIDKAVSSALSRDEAFAFFDYDPATGALRWRKSAGRAAAGSLAAKKSVRGYCIVALHGRDYRAHRLIWFMVYGQWPTMVDHVNGDKSDNRLANLRLATVSQNQSNTTKRPGKTSAFKGVHFVMDKGWRAQIKHKRKLRHLGYFDSEEAAHSAYVAEATKLFGEFANAG